MENKFGYFRKDGREFVITDPGNTPRPWFNFLFNNDYYLMCDQFGRSMSQYQDGKGNWSIVSMTMDEFGYGGNKGVFIRDNETEEFWDTNWCYTQKDFDKLQTVVGLGHQTVESSYNGIESSMRLFVPVEDSVEIWTIKAENKSDKVRKLSFFPFVQVELTGYSLPPGTGAGRYDSYIWAEYLKDQNAIVSVNQIPALPMNKYNSVMAADISPDAFETTENAFWGVGRSLAVPRAVKQGQLSNVESRGSRLLSAMQFNVELEPGESFDLNICLGAVDYKNGEHLDFVKKYLSPGTVSKEFDKLEKDKNRMTESIKIESPDKEMDSLINYWVKQQVNWCTHFSRGWGKGYRDTLQDAEAYRLVENDPDTYEGQYRKYKEILISALTHQYVDGRGTRKWSPINRENYNDAPAWLIFAVVNYLKESGDYKFIEEVYPYLDGEGEATVLEHIFQAARQMLGDRGRHGMVRMRYGDWNDGITGVGAGGEGESVMTTQMLYGNLVLLRELCEKLNLKSADDFTDKLDTYIEEVFRDVNKYAWDGEWYCRAFDDEGNKVGAAECELGTMYVEPQSFGLSQKLASEEQSAKIVKSVENGLESDYGCPLLYPAYKKYDPSVGRLTGHVPGIWENGGIYCHGTAFFMRGLCEYGYGDKFYSLFKKLLASNPKNPSEKSGLEPYILTNCFVGPENTAQPGFARLSWTTGTASWIFRDVLEGMFGIISAYDGLHVNPCLPSEWTEVKQSRFYRNKRFNFTIKKGEAESAKVAKITVNGETVEGNFIPLEKAEEVNEIIVEMA